MKIKKVFLTLVISIIITIPHISFSQNFLWAKAIGGVGGDIGYGITVDASGNVLTTGYFNGTVDFDPGVGVFTLTAVGSSDFFVSKLGASGNFIWAKTIGGSGSDVGYSIANDASGNVLITGNFNGTVDFDPGVGVFTLTATGGSDIFILKLDASGNFVWAKAMGGLGSDVAYFIYVDASSNVYTTGSFNTTSDFDPGAGIFNLISAGSDDIFVSKLNASGNFVWAKAMGGSGSDFGYSIVTDGSGNVYSTGSFNGTSDFDPGAGVFNLTSAGTDDIFVSKLNSTGTFLWAKGMGGTGSDIGYSIGLDASSNVLTTGAFNGTSDLDPGGGIFNLTSAGIDDIFISKLDVNGSFVWAKGVGGTGSDAAYSISLDASGNVFTTGYFIGTVDFDPGAGTFNLTPAGIYDIFVSKLNSAGSFQWAVTMGGAFTDVGYSISNASGNLYTTGSFNATSDFDPGPGVFTLTSVGGGDDVFVHKMCLLPSTPSAINGSASVCAGIASMYSITPILGATSYIWNLPLGWAGSSATNTISATSGSSGIFTVTANNVCGASPTQTLNVTVNATPSVTAVTNNTLICVGQSATLTGSGANSFSWNPGGSGVSISVSPSVTTNYTVTGTNTLTGCSNSFVLTQNVSPCTGINENIFDGSSGFEVYPNPTTGKLIINSTTTLGVIEIYNSMGEIVYEDKNLTTPNKIIDISNLRIGIYFLRIQNKSIRIVLER